MSTPRVHDGCWFGHWYECFAARMFRRPRRSHPVSNAPYPVRHLQNRSHTLRSVSSLGFSTQATQLVVAADIASVSPRA
jgi:hypothetical protein